MPRDSGGTYSLPSGYLATTGTTILASQHNSPLEDIATALTQSLPRDGSAGMTGNLPMGSKKITLLADGSVSTDAATKGQLDAVAEAAATLTGSETLTNKTLTSPTVNGGAINNPTLLLKQSTTPTPTADGDIQWDTDDNVIVVGDGAATKIFLAAPASVASGDIFYASGAKVLSRLAKGTAGQVLAMNGGATAPTWIAPTSGAPTAVLEDQKSSGTDGGTFTSGAWRTRDLNTEVLDASGVISISANQFTPTVDGWVEWSCPAYGVADHQSRLFNVTDSAVVSYGMGNTTKLSDAGGASSGGGPVTANKTYRIEHRAGSTVSTNGFGKAYSFGTEVYTRVLFFRT